MADFNEADILAAKRRVQEMRNRANRFTAEDNAQQDAAVHGNEGSADAEDNENSRRESKAQQARVNEMNRQSEDKAARDAKEETSGNDEAVQDKSFVIILALILILSKEGADSKLILALLYLLL